MRCYHKGYRLFSILKNNLRQGLLFYRERTIITDRINKITR
ncbi:hypothetical protein HMPREF3203_03077 [Proteus mirabilis]|nr:hypothetical protein HMPREF3203_03077 [Proteus mirabilis]